MLKFITNYLDKKAVRNTQMNFPSSVKVKENYIKQKKEKFLMKGRCKLQNKPLFNSNLLQNCNFYAIDKKNRIHKEIKAL